MSILGPDRLFKIVLVGNSSVGKTSLLRRFCDDCFHPGTCATVGQWPSIYLLMFTSVYRYFDLFNLNSTIKALVQSKCCSKAIFLGVCPQLVSQLVAVLLLLLIFDMLMTVTLLKDI